MKSFVFVAVVAAAIFPTTHATLRHAASKESEQAIGIEPLDSVPAPAQDAVVNVVDRQQHQHLERRLQSPPRRKNVGINPKITSDNKLGWCEGDCDKDSDCWEGLYCGQRGRPDDGRIDGCSGTDFSGSDFCIPRGGSFSSKKYNTRGGPSSPSGPSPSPPSGPSGGGPTSSIAPVRIKYIASNPKITSDNKLGLCEGDCDRDSDCWGNMRCLQRSTSDRSVAGCIGTDRSGSDWCVPKPGVKSVSSRKYNRSGVSSPSGPSGPSGSSGGVPSGSFRLKLYWQQGYYWQEERRERKWCIECTGEECNDGEHLLIRHCDAGDNAYFRFRDVGSYNGRRLVQIRAQRPGRSDLCMHRDGNKVRLRGCSSSDLQKWYAQNGSFTSRRFEIVPLTKRSHCVTQRHHPKDRETVDLENCDSVRRHDDTSYWNRY